MPKVDRNSVTLELSWALDSSTLRINTVKQMSILIESVYSLVKSQVLQAVQGGPRYDFGLRYNFFW